MSDERASGDEAGLVEVGVVTRPHGVRGEVRVRMWNAESDLLRRARSIVVRADGGAPATFRVLGAKRSGGADVLRLEGVASVAAAEALRGHALLVARASFAPLAEGEYYHVDLVGLRVCEGERELGRVREVLSYPSVDALLVVSDEGARELPMIPPYLGRIDVAGGRIEYQHAEDFELQPVRP